MKGLRAGVCGRCRAIWSRTNTGHYNVTDAIDCLTFHRDYAWICWGLWTADLTGWQRSASQNTTTSQGEALRLHL